MDIFRMKLCYGIRVIPIRNYPTDEACIGSQMGESEKHLNYKYPFVLGERDDNLLHILGTLKL